MTSRSSQAVRGSDQSQQQRIDAAAAFNMSRVLREYKKKYPVTDEMSVIHERELKRYLALSALYPDRAFPMATGLDDLWHVFLLFSREYVAFCESLGVSFIHHEPCDDGIKALAPMPEFAEYQSLYAEVFGETVPTNVWGGACTCAGPGNGCGSITVGKHPDGQQATTCAGPGRGCGSITAL